MMAAGVPMSFSMSGRLGLDSALTFLGIWLAMMAAMMFPSFWPAVVLYTSAGRTRGNASVPLFILGYLALWEVFGVLAYVAYVAVGAAVNDAPSLGAQLPLFSGVLLIATGLYQVTPMKRSCLGDCRLPLQSLRESWSDSPLSGLGVGLRHGVHCLGSSGGFMVAMVVLGAMDLRWAAAAAVAIALEKLGPQTRLVPILLGLALIVLGVVTILTPASGMSM
jgi:predicted metal-binding membrane protein